LEPEGQGAALDRVLAGVIHHLERDRWFHADPVFADGEAHAARLLAEVTAPRSVLLAHVLWELCLDGALVRRVGLAPVLELLREGLVVASPEALARAAALHHFDRVARSEEDRARFQTRLDRILSELVKGPWIDGYQTGTGVADRLQGVRRAVGLAPMEGEDRARVARIADVLLEAAPPFVARIESGSGSGSGSGLGLG
jgi:hypothetical protein